MEFWNFPAQFYVGLKRESDDDLLGFATPFGTDAAFEKRKDTVDQWAKSYTYTDGKYEAFTIPPVMIDNVPMSKFSFDHSVSRYNTQNKWFRINDPRGFQLEISAANLSKLIQDHDFIKGEIQGEFVWGRLGNVNSLISVTDERYVKFLNPEKKKELQAGDWVISPAISGQYMGKFYVHSITTSYFDEYGKPCAWSAYRYGKSPEQKIVLAENSQPYLVFKEEYNSGYVIFRFARKLSDKAVIKPSEKQPYVPLKQREKTYFFHKTKEEHDNFSLTPEEIKQIMMDENEERYSQYYGKYQVHPFKIESKLT